MSGLSSTQLRFASVHCCLEFIYRYRIEYIIFTRKKCILIEKSDMAKGRHLRIIFFMRSSSKSDSVLPSVCRSVCRSVCLQTVFLYMAKVYIIHNDSLPFMGNDLPIMKAVINLRPYQNSPSPLSGQANKKTFFGLPFYAPLIQPHL